MADEKPAGKPEAKPADTGMSVFSEMIAVIVVLLIVSSLINGLVSRFGSTGDPSSWSFSRFTKKGILLAQTRPIASLLNPVDAKVVSLNDTSVYNSPGDDVIGEQKMGARGRILQGPVMIDGVNYYYVDYEEDPDGWVKEHDIGFVERELNIFERFLWNLQSGFWLVRLLLYIISVIFIIFIIYLYRKITVLSENERKLLYPEDMKIVEPRHNLNWQRVLKYSDSLNENDWRLAIIEADIMLGDLLDKLSLPGDTIGDKLKMIEESDFSTLNNAWEAHKIRNMIAHEGSAFVLNQREVKRAVDLYKSVFEEFEII